MPIGKHNAPLYDMAEWYACHPIVDERARGRCEHCGVPNHRIIVRVAGVLHLRREANRAAARYALSLGLTPNTRTTFWRFTRGRDLRWRDQWGNALQGELRPRLWEGRAPAIQARVRIVLTRAHLNQKNWDHRPENIAALCQWCHNHHDAVYRAKNAKRTRELRKDAGRPLVAATAEPVPRGYGVVVTYQNGRLVSRVECATQEAYYRVIQERGRWCAEVRHARDMLGEVYHASAALEGAA